MKRATMKKSSLICSVLLLAGILIINSSAVFAGSAPATSSASMPKGMAPTIFFSSVSNGNFGASDDAFTESNKHIVAVRCNFTDGITDYVYYVLVNNGKSKILLDDNIWLYDNDAAYESNEYQVIDLAAYSFNEDGTNEKQYFGQDIYLNPGQFVHLLYAYQDGSQFNLYATSIALCSCKVNGVWGDYEIYNDISLYNQGLYANWVTSLKLSKKAVSLKAKSSITLKITLLSTKPDNKAIIWKSSNPKVAKVNSKGRITAIKPGKVTIIATAADGNGSSAKCVVTVKK